MSPEELIKLLTNDIGCQFYPCESSNIVTYGYNEKDISLWVVFKGNKIYQYKAISKEQFEDLKNAESKGKWVNANLVKPKINFEAYELK